MYTVSGTNFVYIFSFLRNLSMQSYSATITCFIVTIVAPHGLLTRKGYTFYKKTHTFCVTSNLFFSGFTFHWL